VNPVTRARTEKRRLPNWAVGLIAIVLVIVGLFLAFTKRIPFTDRGYEVEAVFRNAQNVAVKSPVRIAGVNVGEVIEVEPLPESNAAVLKMTISEQGRPIHTDARVQLRPRLFLEGNYFLDMHPGSPSAPELEEGDTIPIQQTANSVQLDQILTNTLQADVRGNLQLLLRELGDGLQKYGGAEGLRELYVTGEPAYKNTALVNEAFLGTRPHDLSGVVRNFDRVAIALNRNQEQLKGLVTNLRIVTGSFAAEDEALASSVRQLPGVLRTARPVFDDLNAAFPPLRAFAREVLPGVRSTPATVEAALPFIRQLRGLVSRSELRGLTSDLRPTIPQLAKLTRRQVPFLEQARALASCFSNVVIPWSNDEVGDGDTDAAGDPIYPVHKETGYGLVGIAGESRSGDANGQYIRVAVGGGTNTIVTPAPPGSGLPGPLVGVSQNPIAGAEPSIEDSAKTPFRPSVPCENQERPDLDASVTGPPNQFPTPGGAAPILQTPAMDTPLGPALREYKDIWGDFLAARRDLVARKQGAGAEVLEQLARLRRFNEVTYPQAAADLRRSVLGGEG
jgi:phospholipid/cholesterol/gamma-HCH transport system substrate-binding protein